MVRKQCIFLLLLCFVAPIMSATDAAPKNNSSWGSCVSKGFQVVGGVTGIIAGYNVYRYCMEARKIGNTITAINVGTVAGFLEGENFSVSLTDEGRINVSFAEGWKKVKREHNEVVAARKNRRALRQHPCKSVSGTIPFASLDEHGIEKVENKEFLFPHFRRLLPGV